MRRFLIAFSALLSLALLHAQDAGTAAKPIVVTSVSVKSDSRISQDVLRTISNELQNQTYGETAEISERTRYLLQTQGYFKADVGESQVRILSESPLQEIVAVTLAIRLGEQYRLKEIAFSNNKAFSAVQLRGQFPIRDGDILDTEKIRLGLGQLRKLYASNGYINATPVPNTAADDSSRSVSLNIDVDEGVQFRFGPLVLAGEEPRPGAGEELIAAWQHNRGTIYDPAIVEDFWKEHLTALMPPGSSFRHAVEESTDAQQGIVIVRVSFP